MRLAEERAVSARDGIDGMNGPTGILLAGGTGTRFRPCASVVNKHLFPVYDQPMIFYPLALLMAAGVRDIVLVVSDGDEQAFRKLLGGGSTFGISIRYAVQTRPAGIADGVLCCESLVGENRFCVALGDNLFLGPMAGELGGALGAPGEDAIVFACRSADPGQFGVVELDGEGRAVSLEEKPARPRSDLVVPGLYVYPADAFRRIRELRPSGRNELEISALNERYLYDGKLEVRRLANDVDWMDLGTPARLLEGANLICEARDQGADRPGFPEAVAFRNGWIDGQSLMRRATGLAPSCYGAYLAALQD